MQNIQDTLSAFFTGKNIEIFLSHFPGYVIQYLDDSQEKINRSINQTVPKFDYRQVIEKQALGAGVFFSVNGFTNGKRTKDSLANINGVFVDIDVAKEKDKLGQAEINQRKKEASNKLTDAPLAPHFIIETKHGYHAIWRVKEFNLIDFTFIEENLIKHFGADPGAKDICRVLRLPSTYHLKDPKSPYQCKLISNNFSLPFLSRDEITKAFGFVPTLVSQTVVLEDKLPEPTTSSAEIDQALKLPLDKVIEATAAMVGINIAWINNANKSRQIIENREATSGFISSRGEFVHSASGKERRGNQITVAGYYLNDIGKNNYNRQQIAEIILEKFHGKKSLTEIKALPEIIELDDLLSLNIPSPEFIVDKLLPTEGITMINGQPGTFKTWLCLYICYCILNDKPVFGIYEVKKVNILIINLDDPLSLTKARIKKLGMFNKNKTKAYFWRSTSCLITDKETVNHLNKIIKEKDIKLVIFDTLRQIYQGDENTSAATSEVMTTLKKIGADNTCSILVVHHDAKDSLTKSSIIAPSGSTAIIANCISSLQLKISNKDDQIIRIRQGKSKLGKLFEPITIRFTDTSGEKLFEILKDQPKNNLSKIADTIRQAYTEAPKPDKTKDEFIKTHAAINKFTISATENAYEKLVNDKFLIIEKGNAQFNRKIYVLNPQYTTPSVIS